jgi:hypothetical protein
MTKSQLAISFVRKKWYSYFAIRAHYSSFIYFLSTIYVDNPYVSHERVLDQFEWFLIYLDALCSFYFIHILNNKKWAWFSWLMVEFNCQVLYNMHIHVSGYAWERLAFFVFARYGVGACLQHKESGFYWCDLDWRWGAIPQKNVKGAKRWALKATIAMAVGVWAWILWQRRYMTATKI